MREIKFRAWDGDSKIMLYEGWTGKPQFFVNMGVWQFTDKDKLSPLHIMDKKANLHPMQYTGLTDKNGVEIYEGDICEISGANYRYTFEIVWDEQAAGFGFNQVMHGLSDLDFMPDYLDWNEMMIDKIDRVGVISNIYENPELLEANQ